MWSEKEYRVMKATIIFGIVVILLTAGTLMARRRYRYRPTNIESRISALEKRVRYLENKITPHSSSTPNLETYYGTDPSKIHNNESVPQRR